MKALEGMFELLGWQISRTEAKRASFSDAFVSLGAMVDLSKITEGEIVLSNKEGRVEAIGNLIDETVHVDLRAQALMAIR
eukprot:8948999-Karenia_brevis.AAC.1